MSGRLAPRHATEPGDHVVELLVVVAKQADLRALALALGDIHAQAQRLFELFLQRFHIGRFGLRRRSGNGGSGGGISARRHADVRALRLNQLLDLTHRKSLRHHALGHFDRIVGMEQRVALAGGTLELRSASGQGTVLLATFALQPGHKEADR